MADNRKYYYLKLKESYFDDDSIVLLESMQDGILYSYILLKLYLKSLKHGGRLQLDESIPYTPQMIATITRQQIGTVERAIKIFGDVIKGLKQEETGGRIKKKLGGKGMAVIQVECPYCRSKEVSLYGKNKTGRQRYLCRNRGCGHRTFQLEYKNNACRPGVKEKVVEMVMNGTGTRDTGRVLSISKDTVTSVLKKRKNLPSK